MSTDLAQYHELYLHTSKDLITTMKNALQRLKKNTEETQTINDFHRAAHSLKSQSLVMGYKQIGTVNRQLEAFFVLLKQGGLTLNKEYLNMLTDIVAHIEHALSDIDTSEHEPDLTIDIETLNKHTNISN